MITCPQCKKECKDTAKFCGACGFKFQGTAIQPQTQQSDICPSCGNNLRHGAKFCGKCGAKLSSTDAIRPEHKSEIIPSQGKNNETATKEIVVVGSFIQWNILPGQLAVKIDEKDIESYGKVVKGINIQEGVKALVFVHGKLLAELGSGNYPFKGWDDEVPQADKPGIVRRFVGAICNILPQSIRARAESLGLTAPHTPPFSFVLIRTNEFPLIYIFPDIPTSTVSCEVGIHMLLKITNINDFYTNLLLDKKFIGFETIKNELNPLILSQVNFAFRSITPEQVSNSPEFQQMLLPQLQSAVSGIYPYIQLNRILQISAQNADLENFRRMAEELYISERELAVLSQRNEFLTRLQGVKNEQELVELNQANDFHNRKEDTVMEQSLRDQARQIQYENRSQSANQAHELETLNRNNAQELQIARSNADLETAKEKVYEQMQLSADERSKFDLMLSAQAKIREAKSDEEIAVAIQEFKKSGLLRDQEIETLQHQITQKAQLRDLDDAQALSMATMQNQIALDQQKLEWEIQIGNKRIQNQFDRQRIQDAYNDERRDSDVNFSDKRREADADFSDRRRNSDASFEDSRRRSTIDLDRQEQENQFDMLKKAQALRMEREDAEHKREMESEEAARKHELEAQRLAQESEKNKLDAANEEKRIYAGMSFEQIMAANPNLTPQAAQALAKKYEAEAEAAKAQAAIAQNDKTAQMAMDQRDQMMTFMQQQMAMMKDISMAGIDSGARHQQEMLDAKQAELDRTRTDATANSDRFVDGMKTTIEAVSNMGRPVVVAPAAGGGRRGAGNNVQSISKSENTGKICPKCNTNLADDAMFCENCGESL